MDAKPRSCKYRIYIKEKNKKAALHCLSNGTTAFYNK